MMVHDLTEKLESRREEIRDWFKLKRQEIPMPIYGSVDIRDFGWKVGVVDANHFPAGFNNVSQEDRPKLAELLSYFEKRWWGWSRSRPISSMKPNRFWPRTATKVGFFLFA